MFAFWRLSNDTKTIDVAIVRFEINTALHYNATMKTTTSVSISEVGLQLLASMTEKFGINRSAVLEMIIRDYAERNGFVIAGMINKARPK